ncbi:MAG: hypothetical protein ACP5D2_05140, partial [Candidatus Nanoarchaeia archaeon]
VYGTCMQGCESKYDYGYVEKSGSRLEYADSLLYAAIFADEYVYECNVNRLLYRTGRLADLYKKKAEMMNARACRNDLSGELMSFKASLNSSLNVIDNLGKELDRKNDNKLCRLW